MALSSCVSNNSEKDEIQIQEDGSVIIPLTNVPITTVNMTDENGFKQGVWQEDDNKGDGTVYSIVKEYNYVDDTLNGYYLEYKTKSSDTLIFGHYLQGKKHGKWLFWANDENKIEKTILYKHGTIVK